MYTSSLGWPLNIPLTSVCQISNLWFLEISETQPETRRNLGNVMWKMRCLRPVWYHSSGTNTVGMGARTAARPPEYRSGDEEDHANRPRTLSKDVTWQPIVRRASTFLWLGGCKSNTCRGYRCICEESHAIRMALLLVEPWICCFHLDFTEMMLYWTLSPGSAHWTKVWKKSKEIFIDQPLLQFYLRNTWHMEGSFRPHADAFPATCRRCNNIPLGALSPFFPSFKAPTTYAMEKIN